MPVLTFLPVLLLLAALRSPRSDTLVQWVTDVGDDDGEGAC